MKKRKVAVTRAAAELARALGLSPAEGAEIELRGALNTKIVDVVRRKGLTHAQVASLARMSRTRVTAILNRNTKDISTDLLLRAVCAGLLRKNLLQNRSLEQSCSLSLDPSDLSVA